MQKGQVLVFLLVGILILAAAGGAYIFGKSTSPKPSANPVVTSQTPQPISSPTPDETVYTEASRSANWKTYNSIGYTFKYPANWNISGTVITSTSPKVKIVAVPKDGTLMNKCMQEQSSLQVKERPDFEEYLAIKKFTTMTTGEMCSGFNPDLKQIWVVPTKDSYGPGIIYEYSSKESDQPEKIFDQILATFKFHSGQI